MATTLAIIVFALLLTGVATATMYALPIIQQASAAQAQKGDMTQTQDRLRLRDCSQNCDCSCEGNGPSYQGGSETTMGNMYQNRFCEQTCIRSQNRNGLNLEAK